jgi:hypothetical protein
MIANTLTAVVGDVFGPAVAALFCYRVVFAAGLTDTPYRA